LRAQPSEPRQQLFDRMAAVFGAGFVVCPRFTCEAAAAAELASAIASSSDAQDGDPLAAHTWFLRYARVRQPLARLGACLRAAEALDTGEALRLDVAQLPFVAGERWVGLPSTPGSGPPAGKLSLVLQTTTAIDVTAPMTALWIDEWVETVPSTRETTGITFQFDPPDAMAPQAVLLAVPPRLGQDWSVGGLHRVLTETLDLARLRGINPGALGTAAQYLPAVYLAFNVQDDAVSTDLMPLTR
jgi:hypothetical protein